MRGVGLRNLHGMIYTDAQISGFVEKHSSFFRVMSGFLNIVAVVFSSPPLLRGL